MEAAPNYLFDNLAYYVVLLVTLFCWDLMDLYVELRNFKFVWNRTFGAYYWVRAFFCLAIMEVGFVVDLFSSSSKMVMAFVVPLSFSAIIQNLVVKIGGVEKSINLGQVFDNYKFSIKTSLLRKDYTDKVVGQRQVLITKDVTSEMILETCRFYAEKEADFQELVDRTKKLDEKAQKMEYLMWLFDRAEPDIGTQLIEEAKAAQRS